MTINEDDDDNTLYEHEEREMNHGGVFLKGQHLLYTLTSDLASVAGLTLYCFLLKSVDFQRFSYLFKENCFLFIESKKSNNQLT